MDKELLLMLGNKRKIAVPMAGMQAGDVASDYAKRIGNPVPVGGDSGEQSLAGDVAGFSMNNPGSAFALALAAAAGTYGLGRLGVKGLGKGLNAVIRRSFKNPMKFKAYAEYMGKLNTPGGFKNVAKQRDALNLALAEVKASPRYARPELLASLERESANLEKLIGTQGDTFGRVSRYATENPGKALGWLAAAGLATKAHDIAGNIFGGDKRRRGGPVIVQG